MHPTIFTVLFSSIIASLLQTIPSLNTGHRISQNVLERPAISKMRKRCQYKNQSTSNSIVWCQKNKTTSNEKDTKENKNKLSPLGFEDLVIFLEITESYQVNELSAQAVDLRNKAILNKSIGNNKQSDECNKLACEKEIEIIMVLLGSIHALRDKNTVKQTANIHVDFDHKNVCDVLKCEEKLSYRLITPERELILTNWSSIYINTYNDNPDITNKNARSEDTESQNGFPPEKSRKNMKNKLQYDLTDANTTALEKCYKQKAEELKKALHKEIDSIIMRMAATDLRHRAVVCMSIGEVDQAQKYISLALESEIEAMKFLLKQIS